jgi:hypothetical protein
MNDYVIAVAIFVVVAGAIILIALISRQRSKKLAEWALSKGLTFSSGTDSSFESKYPSFDCLRKGRDRYAYNVMYGALTDRVFLGCDYHYVTGHGRHRRDHDFSLVIVKSPILLKPLIVRPENFLDKLAEVAGFDDIDFEFAEFNKKFYVKSPDKKWAYDIINAKMMEFLLKMPVFSIQFDLLSVIVYRDRLFSTVDFEAAINLVNGVFERIPEYVNQNQQLRPV